MSAEDLDNPIYYEQLDDLEDDFEDVELELLRIQDKMSKDLYAKRAKVVSQIPNFWPLVFEQAPPEIDENIQPTDSALLLTSLTGLSVERFELPEGDPRSIAIKFEFSENEYFENKTLEKKFYWRYAKDGWAGLVSEPVDIQWKDGKDLTGGMLALANKVHAEDAAGLIGEGKEETEAQKKFKEQMESTGRGGLSFFAWFGFRGRKVSAEESKEAFKVEQEKRKARKDGKETDAMDEDEDDDDDYDNEYEYELSPEADDIAVCIAEDLWPGAIKYFTTAQEADALSDIDFESDEEMEGGEDGEEGDEHQDKKRKA